MHNQTTSRDGYVTAFTRCRYAPHPPFEGRMATGVGPPNANRCSDERDEDPQQEQPPVRPPRVIRQPHRGGYDCEFLQRPPSGLVQADCPVCLLVLREPHQVTCCGYSYCQNCIKRIQTTQKLCPTCKKEFDTFPDKRLKRSLYALKVYCSHREEGCDWVGELLELDGHLNLQPPPEKLLVGCQFSEVDCTYCVQPFQRRYVQAHQSDDCPKRPYACQHCNKHLAIFKATYEEVMQNHLPVCPFFPLSCPNNCDLELILQRQEVEHYVSRDCPLTLVLCNFHMVGCQVELTRRDMPSHISENLTGHMSLLQAHMMTHPGENMATYLWLMVGSIQKVMLDNANIRSELHEAQETLQDTRNELQQTRDQQQETHYKLQETRDKLQGARDELRGMNDKLQETYGKLQETREELRGTCETVAELEASAISQQEQNESLRRSLSQEKLSASEQKLQATLATQQTTITKCRDESRRLQQSLTEQERKQLESKAELKTVTDDLIRKITASEQKLQTQEGTLNQHQKTLEKVMWTGALPFEFTMTEFEKHKRASDEWYSPPFYTHTHGYRMCIKVYANGFGSGKGTHLAVGGYLMRGDFDNDLQWPFQGAITIQLLNQFEDSTHRTHTIKFTESANPKTISRVRSGERATGGYGTHIFLPHTQLGLNNAKNCQFLKDNQLKFRVSKATNLDPTAHIHRRCLVVESFARAIEPQVCVAPIEFTLSNFERQKKQNGMWHSSAFYTHPRGY